MRLNSLSMLGLLLLLYHVPFSNSKGGKSSKTSSSSKKTHTSTSNHGSSHTNTNTGHKHNQGSGSQGQSEQNNQQGGGGGGGGHSYGQGSTYRGGYGGHRGYGRYGHGGHQGYGGYGGYGGYPGRYINHNPNNKILSPRYSGSFGYGGGRGGSYFSHSVARSGMGPNTNSLGYGRSAVAAAAGGAMVGMAVGYGLGRFPRSHLQFRNPAEEYYYNHYMYKKYGMKSTDTNDYSRDYVYSKPLDNYNGYMDSCMKTNEILPESQKPEIKPTSTITTTTTIGTAASGTSTTSNTTQTNNAAAENTLTSAPSTSSPQNQSEASPVPAASQPPSSEEDNDTVSMTEIGYPSLLEQVKVRRCVERYVDNSDKFLERRTGGGPGLEVGLHRMLAVVTSIVLMLLNSNMLTMLH
ncbi:prion protein b [Parambassis ranga]|uniref:Prion protein b n=1 Tax=Parambassis ranga TaxID=210632 RepID=A0A6P7J1T8_9TELE|nr:keratin, type I cytoskeletal 10-like [Parambassis ranga]